MNLAGHHLEDAWRFPLHTRDGRTFADFIGCMWPATEAFFGRSWLFRLRSWVGGRLRWQDRPFEALEMSEHEALYAVENRTISARIHLAWIDTPAGAEVEMKVYTRPVSRMSGFYMALIRPFRHLWIYPRWIAAVVDSWRAPPGVRRTTGGATPSPR